MKLHVKTAEPSTSPTPLPLPVIPKTPPPFLLPAPPSEGIFRRASQALSRLESGHTGDTYDVAEVPALHAQNPALNALLREVQRSAAAPAFAVNVAANAAGHLVLDLPVWLEKKSMEAGGPSFNDLALAAQTATPGLPWDDLICYGLARWSEVTKIARFRLLKPAITITEEGLAHAAEGHLDWIQDLRKSLFWPGTDLGKLIEKARSVVPVLQRGGNLARIVEAGALVGLDRKGALPTSIYTVITSSSDKFITIFPGKP